MTAPSDSRLRRADAIGLGLLGLRMRPVRSTLSALGIAIGIAAIVGVTGISGSSRADLMDQLDRLGTNLLTVAPGKDLGGDDAVLPTDALGMIRRIPLVEVASAVADVGAGTVRRSPFIPAFDSGGDRDLARRTRASSTRSTAICARAPSSTRRRRRIPSSCSAPPRRHISASRP